MLRGSNCGIELELHKVPAMPDAPGLLAQGLQSSLHAGNRQALDDYEIDASLLLDPMLDLILDPQTSGGLLAAVPAAQAGQALTRLAAAGVLAAQIGRFTGDNRWHIR